MSCPLGAGHFFLYGKVRFMASGKKTNVQELEKVNREMLHVSVRNLVEFVFREGDIDNRHGGGVNTDAMLEGAKIHRKIQNEQGAGYLAEVPLVYWHAAAEYDLEIEGRADGIFEDEDGVIVIDEIKGIYMDLDFLEGPIYVHLAQAMCYAYIYALQNSQSYMRVQMTYCDLDTEERKYFTEELPFEELEKWFKDLMEEYLKWTDFSFYWKRERQKSIAGIEFPFEYRKGQKKLVQDVYRTIAREKNLFIQAPTGVGKTISTVFPAVKAVGEGKGDRIFYLTAKTITATVAKETFAILREQGYKAKIIQLTAKEKLCPLEEMECNPVHCPYALGHYDRVNNAVYELLQKADVFSRDEILAQAEEHQVCPFEMALDVSSFCDDIVCDYNYAFDPNVYLKRFFQEGIKGDYIFLVDEAHNLVERSREMYSAVLCKEDFLAVKKIMKVHSKRIEKALDRCNKLLLEYKRECDNYVIYDNIGTLHYSLMNLMTAMDAFLQKSHEFAGKDEVLDLYFSVRNFLNICELTDEHYVIYTEIGDDDKFRMKLFCVDPSLNLQKCLDKARATIFFSATLLPIHYYKRLLSTVEDNYAVYAESTFSQEQRLLLFGRDVSTKYTRRTDSEFEKMASYIHKTVRCKKGNYMVFFPSYKVMEQVHEKFYNLTAMETDIESVAQRMGMKEQEREEFLDLFHQEQTGRTLVAFCVMGGIFGEGIDLKNDALIGTIIVGTGLPQVSNEREILKNYYDEKTGCGFDYAYRYPGMNKVLQAAGRVIRTTEDVGAIVLLDERFLQRDYEPLFPREWEKRDVCTLDNVEEKVKEFWSCHEGFNQG